MCFSLLTGWTRCFMLALTVCYGSTIFRLWRNYNASWFQSSGCDVRESEKNAPNNPTPSDAHERVSKKRAKVVFLCIRASSIVVCCVRVQHCTDPFYSLRDIKYERHVFQSFHFSSTAYLHFVYGQSDGAVSFSAPQNCEKVATFSQ